MNLIGKTTIHPLVFYSGKIAGYTTWIVMLLSFFDIFIFESYNPKNNQLVVSLILFVGLFFIVVSLINLGKSTRLGLPGEQTVFKDKGLYKMSRNPMYVGFDLLTIASFVCCFNIWMLIMGVYSIIVYHFIILGEEAFLEKRFENQYSEYKKKVRRYL